jgi:hypothetical protein
MDWFWNWGGECFGYREGYSLFMYYGREVGRLQFVRTFQHLYYVFTTVRMGR